MIARTSPRDRRDALHEASVSRRRPRGDRLAILPSHRRRQGAGRLRHVPGARVPLPQLGRLPGAAARHRHGAADPRPHRPLRPVAEAGAGGFSRAGDDHLRLGRPGGAGAPRFGADSSGRRGLQEEAAPQGRPPGKILRGAAVRHARRGAHAAAAESRCPTTVRSGSTTACGPRFTTPATSSARR